MRRPRKSSRTEGEKKISWKRRPSEIRGYQRTLYVNTDNGDYIRVDYNTKDKRVRLYLEDSEDGGIPYYAVINNGKITAERNASTGRACSLDSKFAKIVDIFSSIPNREVIKLINRNYGIGESKEELAKRMAVRKKELEQTRKKYFKEEEYGESEYYEGSSTGNRIELIDAVDFAIGLFLSLALFYFTRDFISMGIVASVFGVLLGFVDIFIRRRDPFFFKMLFFILLGMVSYIYGYYIQ